MIIHPKSTLNEISLEDRYLIQPLALEQHDRISRGDSKTQSPSKEHLMVMTQLKGQGILDNKATWRLHDDSEEAFEVYQTHPPGLEQKNQIPIPELVFTKMQPAKFYAQVLNSQSQRREQVYVTRRITKS
jgi:hypothetical protein